jgi:hypothetical protein
MRLIVLGLVILALTSTVYSQITCGATGYTVTCNEGTFCVVADDGSGNL